MKKLLYVMLLGLLAVPFISHAQQTPPRTPDEICADATPAPEPTTREFSEPEQVLENGIDYRAIFCIEGGAIYVNLFESLAPYTVNSFVFLAQNGYYNNTTFHRVIADFMAQGGDHTGTGRGGPGYSVRDEYVAYMTFDRPGLLATANANNRQQGIFNTNGSQFFITTVVTSHLNYNHSIFGEVLIGQDVVNNIRLRDPQTATTPGVALNTIVIITDPRSVASSYEPPRPAIQDDFAQVIADFEDLPWTTRDLTNTGVFSSDEMLSQLPESVQEDASVFFEQYNHQFTAAVRHVNADCNLDAIPISSLRGTVFAFSSKADAIEAQNDPAFTAIITEGSADFSQITSSYYELPVYMVSVNECNTTVLRARMVRQLGRLLIVTELVYLPESDVEVEFWIDDVSSNLYDVEFAPVFRPEANQ